MFNALVINDKDFSALFILLLVVFFLVLINVVFLFIILFLNVQKKYRKKHQNDESYNDKLSNFSDSLASTLRRLSKDKIGALIAIEMSDDISSFQNNGYSITGKFSPEFVISIFTNKRSALHDGAILISDFKFFAISSYLPMTKRTFDVKYGARHRAAIGMSEINDSVVFVVSETSGRISYGKGGVIQYLPAKHELLKAEIQRIINLNK